MSDKSHNHTIAFYNIENLFDTVNDPKSDDDDFLPTSRKRWTKKRYYNKLRKIGSVISSIGPDTHTEAPIIVGLAEVENKLVLSDLVNSEHLINEKYHFIHYDSSDERGIDVALLYKSNLFEVEHSETYSIYLETEEGLRDFTRDILLVQGKLQNTEVSIIVNHWSSRREGEKETEHKRLASAEKVNWIVKSIKEKKPNTKIIVMGDFNDNPNDKSLALIEEQSNLFNPFKTVWSKDVGSLNHNWQWNLFDQILISANFFDTNNSELSFEEADVFDVKSLTQYHGKFKGHPFRTYVGKKYKGGYSDHFPVYISLKSR
jgi:endonuclease/exonuclease/phosphatase family metal-dependent hydrolase